MLGRCAEAAHEPRAAELARTALHAAPMLAVRRGACRWDIPVHATTRSGSPLLLVAAQSPLATVDVGSASRLQTCIDAAHLYPVAVADRVRSAVRLLGRLELVPERDHHTTVAALAGRCTADVTFEPGRSAVLRLEVERVLVHSPEVLPATGVEVDLARYADAIPDPVVDHEAAHLHHLIDAHPAELAALGRLLDGVVTAGATRVVPVGLDRFGFVVRVESPTGARRARLCFAAPLRGFGELLPAVWALVQRVREDAPGGAAAPPAPGAIRAERNRGSSRGSHAPPGENP